MEAGVDPALAGERRRALRILHEDHRAHRGDGAGLDAFEDPGRGLGVRPQSSAFTMREPADSSQQEFGKGSRSDFETKSETK